MSKRTVAGHFTEPGEYLAEVERDKDLVERSIVRVAKIGELDYTTALTEVCVESAAVIEGRVVRLRTYCGSLWGLGDADEKVHQRASQLVEQLEAGLTDAGLEVRSGVWRDQ